MILTRMQAIHLLLLMSLIIMLNSCQKNATTQNSITFTGYVYTGHISTAVATNGLLIADNPAQNAIVMCSGFSDSAKTASNGSYQLNVETVRRFTELNSDSFTLTASLNGSDERITVHGKPGDSIKARDFILYKHTEE